MPGLPREIMTGRKDTGTTATRYRALRPKPLFRAAAFLGACLVLLGLLLFLAPRLINLAPVQSRIIAHLSRQIGGTLTVERIDLSFFPAPRLTLRTLRAESPGNYEVRAKDLAMTLKGTPLLVGRIEPEELVLENPDVRLFLTGQDPSGETREAVLPLSFPEKTVPVLVKSLPHRIIVRGGRFEIVRREGDPVSLEETQFRVLSEDGSIRYEASCRSPFWKRLSLEGNLGDGERRITLHGPMEGFEPAKVFRFFNSPAPFLTEVPGVDLLLDFHIAPSGKITGTVTSTTPAWSIRSGARPVTLTARKITAGLEITFPGPPSSGAAGPPPPDPRIFGNVRMDLLEGAYRGNPPDSTHKGGRDGGPTGNGAAKNVTASWEGPLPRPAEWRFTGTGTLEKAAFSMKGLPGEVTLSGGRLELEGGKFSFRDSEAALGDSRVLLNGFLGKDTAEGIHLETNVQGTVGEEGARWLSRLARLPEGTAFRFPLVVSGGRIRWSEAPVKGLSLENLVIEKGPRIDLDMAFPPTGTEIKKLEIEDKNSRASLNLRMEKGKAVLSFQGRLAAETLNRLLAPPPWFGGTIEGRVHGLVVPRTWWRSTLEGKVAVDGAKIPLGEASVLRIVSMPVTFHRGGAVLEKAVLELDDGPLVLRGNLGAGEDGIALDLAVEGDEIRWEKLPIHEKKDGAVPTEKERSPMPGIQGNISLSAKAFRYGSLTWQPFRADVTIEQGRVSVKVPEGRVCGISTPGTLTYERDGLSLHIEPHAAGQPLERALACLFGESGQISGTFDLDGGIRGRGQGKDLLRSLSGTMNATARKGRIHRLTLLAKILAVVNITEILRGKLPDLLEEGFAYNTAFVRTAFENGSCLIQEGLIDGASMEIAFHGRIDLVEETMDVTVGVAPLKTADFVVKKIPIIADILGGNLVAIPVRVTGDLKNPSVIPLAPSAVGAGLLGILERTLKLPVKLIEPLIPERP